MPASIELNEAQQVTLLATIGQVFELTLPEGTRAIKWSATAPWLIEPGSVIAEGQPGVIAAQFQYPIGVAQDRWPGMGTTEQDGLRVDTVYRITGTAANQVIYFWPVTNV